MSPCQILMRITLMSTFILIAWTIKSCTEDPNANGILGLYECHCKQNFIFKPSLHLCVLDCNNIQYALLNCEQPMSSITSCVCQQKFQWDANNEICGRDCSEDIFSTKSYDQLQIDQCDCLGGYIWNSQKEKCVRDCSIIVNATGLAEDISKCTCDTGFFYNAALNTCYQPCVHDENSYLNPINDGTCLCIENFIFSTSFDLCVRDCFEVANSDGLSDSNVSSCRCKNYFYWETTLDVCYRNCDNINNSPGTSLNQTNCNCDLNFYEQIKESGQSTCKRDCAGVAYSEENNPVDDPTICKCNANFKWVDTLAYPIQCIVDCVTDLNSPGTNVNQTQCVCNDGFYWDFNAPNKPQCVRDCSDAVFSEFIYNPSNVSQCKCIEKFAWLTINISQILTTQCALSCPNIPNTNSNNGPVECFCDNGFFWLNNTKQCAKQCTGVSYSYQYYNPDNPNQCACYQQFIWSGPDNDFPNQCVINCSMVPYSPGTNIDDITCYCNDAYQWDTDYLQCAKICIGLEYSIEVYNVNFPNQCICYSGFFYNTTVLKCVKNCINVLYNAGTDYTNIVACACWPGLYWSTSPPISDACVRNCSTDSGSNGSYNPADVYQCKCLTGFIWNTINLICTSTCGTPSNPNSMVTISINPFQCSCKPTYTWNPTTLKCVKVSRLLYETQSNHDENKGNLKHLKGSEAYET